MSRRAMRPLYGNAPDPLDPDWYDYYKQRREELDLLFNSEEPPELGWLVEDLIPSGYLTVLTGKPKDGKTSFAASLGPPVLSPSPRWFVLGEGAGGWGLNVNQPRSKSKQNGTSAPSKSTESSEYSFAVRLKLTAGG